MSRKLTYDSWLFGAAMFIVVLGIVMIYSASAIIATQRFGADNPYHFMTRQLVWLFAGGALMLILMHIDLTLLRDRRVLYSLLAIVGLGLVVALFQEPINGTHRWIVLPWFNLQPSEFAKPILILFIATFLARREERINELTTTLLPLASVLCLFAGLILLGRDFGTAGVVLLVGFGMIFVAGVSWRLIGLMAIPLVPAILAFGFGAAYRRERWFAFLNPEADPLGRGVSTAAVADRARHRRAQRTGHRQRTTETLLPSRAAHRFHLLDRRRRAWIRRRDSRSSARSRFWCGAGSASRATATTGSRSTQRWDSR